MKTIIEAKENVSKLLGKQRLKDTRYRLMKYVLCVKINDEMLLHNVITGQLVSISKKESEEFLQSLPIKEIEPVMPLVEDYFLVPVAFNERDVVDKLRLMMRRVLTPVGVNNYVIFTTTNCNARCFYCFESDCERINMSSVTAKNLVEYMIAHKGEGVLRLRWFGGEPLMCVDRIDQICGELRSRNTDYLSTMISNGYLFSKEIIDRSIEMWNLKKVQITLDGTEEVYNKIKAYVTTHGSPYQRVLQNIHLLLEKGILVDIRLNVDQSNSDNLVTLSDELADRFPGIPNLHVYASVVEKDLGFAPIARTELDEAQLYQQQTKLTRHLDQLGLLRKSNQLPSISVSHCMADKPNSLAVYPDGRFYKCEHIIESDWIGDIEKGVVNKEKAASFTQTVCSDDCSNCPLYPDCVLLKKCPVVSNVNAISCESRREAYRAILKKRYASTKGIMR